MVIEPKIASSVFPLKTRVKEAHFQFIRKSQIACKLTSIVFSEFGESIDQEIVEYDSGRENGNLASVSSNRPGSENESARGTDSADGGFVLIKRGRLETAPSCTVEKDVSEANNISRKKEKGKSGPKAMWSTEMLNDLVDGLMTYA